MAQKPAAALVYAAWPGTTSFLQFAASLVDHHYRQRADQRGRSDVDENGSLGPARPGAPRVRVGRHR